MNALYELEIPPHLELLEWYKWSFKELSLYKGEEFATDKVKYYLERSKEYAACKSFVIHECNLLSTYKNPAPGPMVSVFYTDDSTPFTERGIQNVKRQVPVPLAMVAKAIRSKKYKQQTDKLRTLEKNDKVKKLCPNRKYKRLNFSYATFSGVFTSRDDTSLVKHSGLICIDLDQLNEKLQRIREQVIADPNTVMCFVSPNGDGLKVLYEMKPDRCSQHAWYEGWRKYIAHNLLIDIGQIDKSCKDVSRACFLPHDPNVYLNPHYASI